MKSPPTFDCIESNVFYYKSVLIETICVVCVKNLALLAKQKGADIKFAPSKLKILFVDLLTAFVRESFCGDAHPIRPVTLCARVVASGRKASCGARSIRCTVTVIDPGM